MYKSEYGWIMHELGAPSPSFGDLYEFGKARKTVTIGNRSRDRQSRRLVVVRVLLQNWQVATMSGEAAAKNFNGGLV